MPTFDVERNFIVGVHQTHIGKYDAAEGAFEAMAKEAKALGHWHAVARARSGQAMACYRMSRHQLAATYCEEAMAAALRAECTDLTILIGGIWGGTLFMAGELELGRERLETTLQRSEAGWGYR